MGRGLTVQLQDSLHELELVEERACLRWLFYYFVLDDGACGGANELTIDFLLFFDNYSGTKVVEDQHALNRFHICLGLG